MILILIAETRYCKQVKSIKHIQFLKQVIEHMVSSSIEEDHVTRPARPGRFSSDSSNLLRLEFHESKHWPAPIPPTARKKNPRRDCVVCKSHRGKGKRWVKGQSRKCLETKYFCAGCDGGPALCTSPCFEKYHTCRDY